MQTLRPVGRGASARKYDILTALGAFALAQGKHEQRRVLRLMTLITARYNWARDELAVGQRESARLWAVDERTVKREMARLKAAGWLVVKRQGAFGTAILAAEFIAQKQVKPRKGRILRLTHIFLKGNNTWQF